MLDELSGAGELAGRGEDKPGGLCAAGSGGEQARRLPAGFNYRDISTGVGHPVPGGLLNTNGRFPGYAIFVVLVDVAATCDRVVELGGQVDLGPLTTETGLSAAYLSDRDGNRFGVFTPPPAV